MTKFGTVTRVMEKSISRGQPATPHPKGRGPSVPQNSYACISGELNSISVLSVRRAALFRNNELSMTFQ